MTRITDGKKTVEIVMQVWDNYNKAYRPDFSEEFFIGKYESYNALDEEFAVDDVDYCVAYLLDYMEGAGDFDDDDLRALDNEYAIVDYVEGAPADDIAARIARIKNVA